MYKRELREEEIDGEAISCLFLKRKAQKVQRDSKTA